MLEIGSSRVAHCRFQWLCVGESRSSMLEFPRIFPKGFDYLVEEDGVDDEGEIMHQTQRVKSLVEEINKYKLN